MANGDINDRRGALPVPDPTLLTTEALVREISHLRELLTSRIEAVEEGLNEYQRHHDERHRSRINETTEAIQHLTELAAERFAGIQTQLVERDSRVQESSQASKDAIAAALAAQKEAVDKSEQATKEGMTSMRAEIRAELGALRGQVDDLKGTVGVTNVQVGAGEGDRAGRDRATTTMIAIASVIVAIIVGVAVVAGVGLST